MPWNTPPPILHLTDEAAYEAHFVATLSSQHIATFDGLEVKFPRGAFNHAFFRSANRWAKDKSLFDIDRAQRMDWIAWALANPTCDLRQAWRSDQKKYDPTRRLCITPVDYCVWIQVPLNKSPYFVTAFMPEPKIILKLKGSPVW